MKTRLATKNDIGKPCIRCGHSIYYIKRYGYRCMCDTPTVYISIFDKK